MFVYFDQNGVLKEVITEQTFRVGDSKRDKIYVYWEGEHAPISGWVKYRKPDGTDYPVSVEECFYQLGDNLVGKTLPTKPLRNLKYFSYDHTYEENGQTKIGYKFYQIRVPDSVLNISNDDEIEPTQNNMVIARIRFVMDDGQYPNRVDEEDSIETLGAIVFSVETNIGILTDSSINETQYNYLISLISMKLGFNITSQKVQELPEVGVAGTIYYVEQEDDGIIYDAYFWNGTEYVFLGTTSYGLYTEQEGEDFENNILSRLQQIDGVNPVDYGAVGDGETDDTIAMRNAVSYCLSSKKSLVIPRGKIFYITDSINYSNGSYIGGTLQIVGYFPERLRNYSNSLSEYGLLKLSENISLFKNATIKLSMTNVGIVGFRNESCIVFNGCNLNNSNISGCSISNIGSFFYNTSFTSTSSFTNNILLSVFNFAKCTQGNIGCVDSFISGNYINGGAEPTDNACFEWDSLDGTMISNNFIDYYKIIYRGDVASTITFRGGVSVGNVYQVFLYFYWKVHASSTFIITSIGDTFEWTDPTNPTVSEKFALYGRYSYTNPNTSATAEIPPYICAVGFADFITIKDAIITATTGNLLVIGLRTELLTYDSGEYHLEIAGQFTRYYATDKIAHLGSTYQAYNWGTGRGQNNRFTTNICPTVSTLPQLSTAWSYTCIGEKCFYHNKELTAKFVVNDTDAENIVITAKWVDEFGNAVN